MNAIIFFGAFTIFATGMLAYLILVLRPYLFRIHYDSTIYKAEHIHTTYPIHDLQSSPFQIYDGQNIPDEYVKQKIAQSMADYLLPFIEFREQENTWKHPPHVKKEIAGRIRIVDERASFIKKDQPIRT